ncbi:hypothetical protein GCM10023314_30190 [Algibacter agarivorans]|uniref:Glycoside hydrolase 123 C-terminal domain-containing protein n=1 Tax=Algibacter agarivorans TaxID=1109741 RepID=A0ABP9GZC5_9FLAO
MKLVYSKCSFKLLLISLLITFTVGSQVINGSIESKFKRYQKGENFSGTLTQVWSTVAWKGERINTQMVIWSNSKHKNLEYKIEAFKNDKNKNIVLDKANISLRFPSYVKGDLAPRSCTTVVEGESFEEERPYTEVADALLEKTQTELNPEDLLKLWLTIELPRNLISGIYKGTIVVTENKKEVKTFKIEIQVLDKILPKVKDWEFHLDIWQWPLQVLKFYNISETQKIKPWSDEHFNLLARFYKPLSNMGQKVIFTQLNDGKPPLVKWIKDSNGKWSFNFDSFDVYVSLMEKLGITKQISCHSILGSKNNKLPYFSKNSNAVQYLELEKWSEEYNAVWSVFLKAFKQHLIQKGWFEKTALYLDELRQEEMDEVVNFIQNLDSDWKLALAYGHVQSQNSMNLLYDASGILGVANTTGRKDKINTFYTSCTETIPNNYTTPQNNVAEMTWMPWHAAREGFNGYLRWAYDYWTKDDPFDTRDGGFTSGDFSMIYRSSNGKGMKPVMGIRTEMLREGIQDFEKIEILEKEFIKNKDSVSLTLLKNMVSEFSASSGVHALTLVARGQALLKDLSLGNLNIELEDKPETERFNIQYYEDFHQIVLNIKTVFTEVEVLTYSGKRILLQKYDSPVAGGIIDLSNLQPDFYLIRIKSKDKIYVEVVKID